MILFPLRRTLGHVPMVAMTGSAPGIEWLGASDAVQSPQYPGWPPTKNDWTLDFNSAEGRDLHQDKQGHYLTFWNKSNVTMHHGAPPSLPHPREGGPSRRQQTMGTHPERGRSPRCWRWLSPFQLRGLLFLFHKIKRGGRGRKLIQHRVVSNLTGYK